MSIFEMKNIKMKNIKGKSVTSKTYLKDCLCPKCPNLHICENNDDWGNQTEDCGELEKFPWGE